MNKRLKPQIRFKGFEDDWENIILKDICSYQSSPITLSDAKEIGKYPLYDANKQIGYINTSCINVPYISIIKDGAGVGRTRLLPAYSQIIGTLGAIKSKENIDLQFLLYLFNILNLGNKISGSTIPHIYFSQYGESNVIIPDSSEQIKIGTLLSKIEFIITESERELNRLEKMKQASLQKMFPRPGTTTPEIRFMGFTEPWELLSIGDMFSEGTSRGGFENLLSVSINDGVYPTTDFIKTHTVKSFSNYKNVHKHDIVYNSMRMWQGASGVSYWDGIVSPAYTVLCPKENVYSPFIGYYFKLGWVIKIFELNSQGLTKDTWNIKYPAISLLEFYVPKDLKEQQAIAEYFCNLDSVISSKRQKLAKLRQIKQACLDKMFVNATEL